MEHLKTVLTEWDIPPVLSIEAVSEGHPVFRIITAAQSFTLKEIPGGLDLPRLEFTHDVLTHVAKTGLQVPVPLPARSFEYVVSLQGRTYLLYRFIEAGAYPNEPELQPELFYQTGQAIARLHHALATYPDSNVSARTWRQNLGGELPAWFATLTNGLVSELAAIVKRVELERGASIQHALQGLPEQLIHRDCHPGNVLVQGTHVSGFVDCDLICMGPRIFDVAYYAVHHLKWVTDNPVATDRWLTDLPYLLNGYRSQQSLLPAEISALPHAMMAYHLLLAAWFLEKEQHALVPLELRALDWLHKNFDAVHNAIVSS